MVDLTQSGLWRLEVKRWSGSYLLSVVLIDTVPDSICAISFSTLNPSLVLYIRRTLSDLSQRHKSTRFSHNKESGGIGLNYSTGADL